MSVHSFMFSIVHCPLSILPPIGRAAAGFSLRRHIPHNAVVMSLYAIFLLLSAVPFISADGKAYYRSRDMTRFEPVAEKNQYAWIHQRDGRERMVISISLDLDNEDEALWIFPVKGSPENIKAALIDRYPDLLGRDPVFGAKGKIAGSILLHMCSQFYPIPFFSLILPGLLRNRGEFRHQGSRWGLSYYVAAADSSEALAEYLSKETGKNIQSKELDSFKPYMTREYSLIIITVHSRGSLLKEFPDLEDAFRSMESRRPFLYIDFPSDTVFYPMKATAGYGELEIPVTLFIIGYYAFPPDSVYNEMPSVRTRHFYDNYPDTGNAEFYKGLDREQGVTYTRITIEERASEYIKGDITLERAEPPFSYRYAVYINTYMGGPFAGMFIVLSFLLLSYLAAGTAAKLKLGTFHPYAFIGFTNVLTLYGLHLFVKYHNDPAAAELREWNRESRGKLRSLSFTLSFSLLFVVLTILLSVILILPFFIS